MCSHEVWPGLLVGSIEAAFPAALAADGVTHVVCCVGDEVPSGLPTLHLPLEDAPAQRIGGAVLAATRFVADALGGGGRVLVHCHMGISRSAAVASGYLVVRHGLDADAALRLVASRRPAACPNPGFVAQLRAVSDALAGVPAAIAEVAIASTPAKAAEVLAEMALLRER